MKWEIKGFSLTGEFIVMERGDSMSCFPDAKRRKMLREAGYKIYLDGKLFDTPHS